MKEDRYEIKGKIGQGGIGVVYRASDKRLNRDVAIKRVLPEGGFENQEEAIEHLLKEAKSLSSIQHPHIVTVYDAGVDEEGPYVVMELLAGRTLDEMIERGSLTYEDFREVAVQTQEALIAAQDLALVHRDLKPTNVMVTWLPSGKFQMKLVDFGLAKFSAKPSLQTIDHGDAVFGSIHFMAPEQFERTPLDQRTDMYSMGCMYYFALTGLQPFGGDSASEVMASHLQHRVTSLSELRPDLAPWVCDWVMWHIERKMDKRPSNARESLQKFLMNEQQNPENSEEPTPEKPRRPKLVFPGAEPTPATPAVPATPVVPVTAAPAATIPVAATPPAPPAEVPTGTAPQPIEPPASQPPSLHTTGHVPPAPSPLLPPSPPPAPPASPPPPPAETIAPPAPLDVAPPPPAPAPSPAATTPVNLAPPPPASPEPPPAAAPVPPAQPVTEVQPAPPAPAGQFNLAGAAFFAVSATTSRPLQPGGIPAPGALGAPAGAGADGPSTLISGSTEVGQKGLSNAIKITLAAVLVVAIIFTGIFVIAKAGKNKEAKAFNELVKQVEDAGAKDLPTTGAQAAILLRNSISLKQITEREAIYQRLLVAKSSDDTDLDSMIAEFASNEENGIIPDIRTKLFQVVQRRKGRSSLPHLIAHAQTSSNPQTATAALKAAEQIATEKDISSVLNIIKFSTQEQVRQGAKRVITSLAARSDSRKSLAADIKSAYDADPTDEAKLLFVELLGAAGGDVAAAVVQDALKSKDNKLRLAAVAALGNWADDSQFETLLDHMATEENDTLRTRGFDSAFHFLKIERERDEVALEDMWKLLARLAQVPAEKLKIVTGLANIVDDWAFAVVEFFVEDEDDKVSFRAEQALERMEERRKRINPDAKVPKEKKEDEEEAGEDPDKAPDDEKENPADDEIKPAEEKEDPAGG